MRFTVASLVASLALGGVGCGSAGDSVGVNGYEYVAGSYSGPVSASDGGATFSGTLSIDVEQRDDANNALIGTYTLSGTVTGGPSPGSFLRGQIVWANPVAGANPSFSLALINLGCPLQSDVGAKYVSGNRHFLIRGGELRIYPEGPGCSALLYDFVNLTGELSPI